MRIITLGNKTLKEINENYFSDFLYRFGFCGSPEFWSKPIVSNLDWDGSHETLHFDYYQLRKDDNKRMDKTGHVSIENLRLYICNKGDFTKPDHYIFSIEVINFLINEGFDVPFYNSL